MRRNHIAVILIMLAAFAVGFVSGPKIRQAQIENLRLESIEWRLEDRLNKLIEQKGLSEDPEIKAILDENERGFVVQGFSTSDYTDGVVYVAPKITPKVEKLLRKHLTFGMPWVSFGETLWYFD